MIKFIFIILVTLLSIGCSTVNVKKYNERYYQIQLCEKLGGEMEVVLQDRTRVDCLTDEYAIEVDFAKKWAEGIGQSLYYAYMTHKKPAIGLIIGQKDSRFLNRLQKSTKKLNIKIFLIKKKK